MKGPVGMLRLVHFGTLKVGVRSIPPSGRWFAPGARGPFPPLRGRAHCCSYFAMKGDVWLRRHGVD